MHLYNPARLMHENKPFNNIAH